MHTLRIYPGARVRRSAAFRSFLESAELVTPDSF